MDSYLTKAKIINILSEFKYHPEVLNEINQLVLNKGIAKEFINIFLKNTGMIKKLGPEVTKLSNFEKLKGVDDLYSMKFKGKNMNLRILFSYNSRSNIVLLLCFYERSGSRKTSYKEHIDSACSRKKEI